MFHYRWMFCLAVLVTLILSACQPVMPVDTASTADENTAMDSMVEVKFYTSHGGHERFGIIDLVSGAGTDVGHYENSEVNILRTEWFAGNGAIYENAFYVILNKRLPSGATPDDAEARLARVDMQTAEVELLGSVIPLNVGPLEVDHCGEIYTAGFTLSNDVGELFGDTNLYRVDREDGSLTLIGDTGIERIMDLTFDPEGTLWATTGNVLYTLDMETGTPTEVAQITGVEEDNEIMGIGFTSEGELYGTTPWSDGFYRIDPASGAVTEVGRHGFVIPHGGDIPMMPNDGNCENAAYPAKPITMIVGYAEGGGADAQARAIAKIMEEEWGQPVNVVNVVGEGGTLAARELVATAPDGYNLAFAVSTALTYNPVLQNLDYEVDDFDIVSILMTFQTAIVTYAEAPYDTWAEFVAWAKENPGAKYLHFGAESKLAMEIVAAAEGLELEYVSAGGGADMVPAVQGKEVDIAFSGGIHARYLDVEEDKMKVLMSTLPNGQSLQATPDVPNMHDLGYNYETAFHGMIMAPAGLPEHILQKLANMAEVVANHPEYAEVLASFQYPITFIKGDAARTLIEEQRTAFETAQ